MRSEGEGDKIRQDQTSAEQNRPHELRYLFNGSMIIALSANGSIISAAAADKKKQGVTVERGHSRLNSNSKIETETETNDNDNDKRKIA